MQATRSSFKVGAMDLVVSSVEWSREQKATKEEGQALGTVLKSCRTVGRRRMKKCIILNIASTCCTPDLKLSAE